MNKIVGSLFLIVLLILPAALVVGFSYVGTAHPIEKSVIVNDAFLKESTNDIEILFFGFAGCATVCPTSLGKIASVLETDAIKGGQTSVGGLFVEVKSKSGDAKVSAFVDQYSRAFSSQIRGYAPGMNTYQQLAREFIIRLHESSRNTGQISHTDHFFILVRDGDRWFIDRVLKNHIDTSEMSDIVTLAINNLE